MLARLNGKKGPNKLLEAILNPRGAGLERLMRGVETVEKVPKDGVR
jgi:hypothetical protein